MNEVDYALPETGFENIIYEVDPDDFDKLNIRFINRDGFASEK